MADDTINLAARVPATEAEGPGRRFALWVQGCPFRCAGCCNPQYLDFRPAESVTVRSLLAEIEAVSAQIEGITLVGGEPFSQAAALATLAQLVQERGLTVMTFTGHRLEDLQVENHEDYEARLRLIRHSDLLVDGLYQKDQPDTRRWIGSRNQRVHFLSDAYQHLRDNWDQSPNTIELRLVDGEVCINGFPHQDITALSRTLRRK